ncbi:hypothetical protein SteCoe_5611 [Stentor coeruleus]|uniref:C2H2-type domain-containing protein n=1 Tax=Stentor coeruleus TaxID=5963 RepID=A0A1R2CS61_9CILI|nr:hypothetical protein SteCoe_5611 [Stentor coeruleus]
MKTPKLYCEVSGCKKTFKNQESLENHIKNDHCSNELTVNFDYKCPTCFKNLSTKQSLKEHFYTHTGERPYKCLEIGCGLTFRQSSQLSNHRKVHLEIKKKNPKSSEISFGFLSELISQEDFKKCEIPDGPFSGDDVNLPKIDPTGYKNVRICGLFEIK